jgi:RNA 2',3'-cyclic 3'-phosphodiesterase
VRLFAAIDPPVDDVQLPVDERLRWVPREQWHVTLAFYGEVDDAKAERLLDGLARAAARSRPVRIRMTGAGTFPRQSTKARVLWLGLDGEVEELRRLADRCAGAGRRARIAMEDRACRPHLTLARARREPVDATDVVAALSSYVSPWWTVPSLRLVRSFIGPQTRHETLREWPLGE